jgi:hypothetical protein
VPMSFTTKTISSYLMLKLFIFGVGIIFSYSGVAVCAEKNQKDRGEESQVPTKTIEEVLKEHTSKLMSIPGVVGTAQSLCEGQPCIKVFVSKKTEKLEQKIPKILEGYPVVIQKTGKFKALPGN